MTERDVEYRPLSGLVENPGNPKLHDTAGIGASMGRFGLIDVIVEDGRTGFIVSGHGRRKTLLELHAAGQPAPDGVEVRTADTPSGDEWWVPVVVGWASADDDEAAAATVALNRWTELGGWDLGSLIAQLDGLAAGPGLDGVGFSANDLDDVRARWEEETTPPPPPEDPWGFGDSDRQVRSLMLDLPLPEYKWATEVCARARTAYKVDSNAELFLVLLEADAELAARP